MQTEAMSKEDFERQEKGLPPLKIKKIKRPEPKRPDIENEIKFEDIPVNDFMQLEYARRKTLKNEEGMRFIGFDVSIILSPDAQLKRKPGRPSTKEVKTEEVSKEPKILSGWMNEGDFLSLLRTFRKKIDIQVIQW